MLFVHSHPSHRRGGRPRPAAAAQGGRQQQANGILRFYTDDAPGIKVGPTIVLVMSLSFIGIVVLLHIYGKLRS
jgi:protein transport protein SEC61 subunit beta